MAKDFLKITSLLFGDIVVLLASLNEDLQQFLGQFAGRCESTDMKIGTFQFQTMAFSWKRIDFPLWVGNKLLLQVEDFKYRQVLLQG